MKEESANARTSAADNEYSMSQFFASCVRKWYWFLISIVVICSMAFFYVVRQQPKYMRTEQVLIKEQDEGTASEAVANSFSTMGIGSSHANVYNELITFKSPALMTQVVNRLSLNDNYVLKGFPHGTTLYSSTLPFTVDFSKVNPDAIVSFRIDLNPGGSARLYKFQLRTGGDVVKFDKEVNLRPGFKTVNTPIGQISFVANPTCSRPLDEEETIIITHVPTYIAVQSCGRNLKVDLADRDAEVIDISYTDVNIERAEDILNAIVKIYNQDWINDKNKVAVATDGFLAERLARLEVELSGLDSKILDYKSASKLPDMEESVRTGLALQKDMATELLRATNELGVAKYVRDHLNDPSHKNDVIPVNTGIVNIALETQIAEYNKALMQRNVIADGSSANNPIVAEYDTQLKGIRESIVRGMDSYVKSLTNVVANWEGEINKVDADVVSTPQKAKYLMSKERQQKVMEELYLYLLQKREENSLSQTFTATNTRIITPPYGSMTPVKPKKMLIMGLGFLMALILPGALIYIKESHDNKVRNKHDLDNMSTPYAGEIPFMAPNSKDKFAKFKKIFTSNKKKKKELETIPVMVEAGNRDVLNESFRIVRSNIDFMIHHDDSSNVLMITSFNPGSGKSFITFNLGASFAIKGKSVLIIDCDLRHGSSSQFVGMPNHGISNYLTGGTDNWEQFVVPVSTTPGLSVMPIGHRPPNPAELLDNGRIGKLIEEASEKYDYVFLDCPPIDVVVDTQIMEKYADTTLFVVRAGLLEKSVVPEIDAMYKNHRFKRMCILLNGTEGHNSRYNTYGSSYYMSDF